MQLKNIIWAWLIAFWSASAWAAQLTFANDLAAIPPAAIAVSCGLAFIGGAAYTSKKLADPNTVLKSVFLEVVKDLLASIVAGMLAFFAGAWLNFPFLLQAICITIAGYGGSRVLERSLDNFLLRIDRIAGKTGEPS